MAPQLPVSRLTADFVLSLLGPHPRLPKRKPNWVEVVDVLRFHRLLGLVVARHRQAGGGLLPDGVAAGLEGEYRALEMAGTVLLEAAERARGALGEAGIGSLYFKGSALIRSGGYPGPGARTMDDADLLVRPGHARAAVEVLEAAGFVPWTPWEEGREGWSDSFTLTAPGGVPGLPLPVVDLHWRTAYGDLRFGSTGTDSILWDDADTRAGLPRPEPHLVVTLEHVLKHIRFQTHFLGLADAAVLGAEVRDWDSFFRLARSRRHPPGLGLLLDLAREDLGLPVPPQAVSVLGADGLWLEPARYLLRPRRLLGRESPASSRAGGILLRWILAGSPWRALRDAGRAAFPERAWLRARYAPGEGSSGAHGEEENGAGAGGTLTLRLRYWWDVARWLVYRGRSPASPNQDLFDPRARR